MASRSATQPRRSPPKKRSTKPAWRARPQSRAEQRLLKEEVLYETAAQLFGRHGFHGTSLSDLAEELGTTKANLYNYVRDKSELLYRLHLRSLDVAETAHRTAIAEGKTGLERVALIARNYVLAVTGSLAVSVLILEDDTLLAEQAAEILARRRWLEHNLREQIALGIEDGSMAPCDAKLMSLNIVGMLHWTTHWYDPKGSWSGPQIAEAMRITVTRMLARHPGALPLDITSLPLPPAGPRPRNVKPAG